MSAPLKPWEQRSGMQQHQQILNSSSPMQMMQAPVGRVRSSGLPQLPPRPGVSSYGSTPYSYMGGSYPSRYNSYSYGNYGGMGGYGGYGGMGGMGGYGMGGFGGMYGGMYGSGYGMNPESRFIQLAEESTRPAFQGIESLVRAFSSISMMLDSTFFAVTSSFRAVLGVAENFGQIRSMFGQIWSSFALLRFVNWCYRKVLRLFGVKIVEDLGKDAWNQAISETGVEITANSVNNTSSWPIFMFLGMIVSAPYFISRLLPPIIDKSNPKNWPEPGRKAIAQYPFQASNAQEMSLRPGEEILIAPKVIQDELQLSGTGWILAASRLNSFGMVPINYIQLAGGRQKTNVNTSNTPNLKISDFSAAAPNTSNLKSRDISAAVSNTSNIKMDDVSAAAPITSNLKISDSSADMSNTPNLKFNDISADMSNTSNIKMDDVSAAMSNTSNLKMDDVSVSNTSNLKMDDVSVSNTSNFQMNDVSVSNTSNFQMNDISAAPSKSVLNKNVSMDDAYAEFTTFENPQIIENNQTNCAQNLNLNISSQTNSNELPK